MHYEEWMMQKSVKAVKKDYAYLAYNLPRYRKEESKLSYSKMGQEPGEILPYPDLVNKPSEPKYTIGHQADDHKKKYGYKINLKIIERLYYHKTCV